jgi:acetyltransferase-like isoleucine patch superfamily enzyme
MVNRLKKYISKTKHLIFVFFFKNFKKKERPVGLKISNIAVLYYVPKDSPKANIWHDGFTAAIEKLKITYNVKLFNLSEYQPLINELNTFDFIIVKSNWNWIPDNYLRKKIKKVKAFKSLMISGVNPPPAINEMLFYDVLYFETFWYYPQIKHHPNCVHAFGIDKSVMYKMENIQKKYDWICVGAFTNYKRYNLFLEKQGRKIAIGESHYSDSSEIIGKLKERDVEIYNFMPYPELVKFYNESKALYVPATVDGGGERAVLEARACGIDVFIEEDNPKLKELLKSPIWDEDYYSQQLIKGIENILNSAKRNPYASKIESNEKLLVGKHSYHNGGLIIKGDEAVYIGHYCAIGENIKIITSNHDYNYPSIQGWFYKLHFNQSHPGEIIDKPNKARTKGPVKIGSDVWIGDNAIILSGVNIGDGCCIGAGSIVVNDLPPYTICAGCPAKVIKQRYDQYTINKLCELKWWNWSDEKIRSNKQFFDTDLNKTAISTIDIKD